MNLKNLNDFNNYTLQLCIKIIIQFFIVQIQLIFIEYQHVNLKINYYYFRGKKLNTMDARDTTIQLVHVQ